MTDKPDQPDAAPRSPDEIERELDQIRQRLASSVDALAEEAHPAALARRSTDSVKAFYVGPDGQVRTDRVLKTVAVVVTLVVLRRIVRRNS
jgi:hypothetical protein